jgi:ankyrin repeat protein
MRKGILIVAALFFLGILGVGFWANQKVKDMPPVLQAVFEKDQAKLRAVIEQGNDVNAPGPMGLTALVFAVKQGDLETVKLLVENGAHVDTRIGEHSLIELAEKDNQTAIAEYLRQAAQ